MPSQADFKEIAVIGCGSMGGGLALLFAENGLEVHINDPNSENADKVLADAKSDGLQARVHKHEDQNSLLTSLSSPRLVLWSLPHGNVGDKVLEIISPTLQPGDIILDAANEHYENSSRRLAKCASRGVHYICAGVSGGYQAARRGPSICPSGDKETLNRLLPLLERVAAKDNKGRPAVAWVGFGSAGHYVKMVHNGIEHGMMCAISEAWDMMEHGLGMSLDDIASVFEEWNERKELSGTFLIKIAGEICRERFHDGPGKGGHVLPTVQDKVVQDITGEEGTGVWTNMESVRLHVPSPTMADAHFFRIASAYRGHRNFLRRTLKGGFPQQKMESVDKKEFLEHLRLAVYATCLASFIQGIKLIETANEERHWDIDFASVWQIWRAGCIIQADYISDQILSPAFHSHDPAGHVEMFEIPNLADDIKKCYSSLKYIISQAIAADAIVPSMGATLEWIKYESNTNLPASFYEAELDYFGAHMYDQVGEENPGPTEGTHHYEWKAR